jgi:NitT/TauT family transport system permease protein
MADEKPKGDASQAAGAGAGKGGPAAPKTSPASKAAPATAGQPPEDDAANEEEQLEPKGGLFAGFFRIRDEPGVLAKLFWGTLCVALVFFLWWYATRGPVEHRILNRSTLGSPAEVFGSVKSLWFDRALTRNTLASLVRVVEGYGLALLIGIPLGILGGCFRRVSAFLAPITLFGRNIPVAALLPLTVAFFGIDEMQKVLFLFIACVAFVISDAAGRIADVDQKYLDTAYTLGASRPQVIFKVLIPLALPDLFNSMRLLFGLAFGYIILVEAINMDKGLGTLIMMSERQGPRDHIVPILLVITLLAYVLDRLLFWIGKQLFPYRFRED